MAYQSDESIICSQCNCPAAATPIDALFGRNETNNLSEERRLLSSSLKESSSLCHHWKQLNGCLASASHMTRKTLSLLSEAIGRTLQDHQQIIDGLSKSPQEIQVANYGTSAVFLGSFKMDDEDALIVIQEALSDSLLQLALVLQGIKEEAILHNPLPECQNPLQLGDLATTIFRLLGQVGELGNHRQQNR